MPGPKGNSARQPTKFKGEAEKPYLMGQQATSGNIAASEYQQLSFGEKQVIASTF